MPVAAKTNAFKGKIGGDQRILPGPRTQDSAVVSYSREDIRSANRAGRLGHAADLGDQRFLGKHGSRQIYAKQWARVEAWTALNRTTPRGTQHRDIRCAVGRMLESPHRWLLASFAHWTAEDSCPCIPAADGRAQPPISLRRRGGNKCQR